jgi:hypothetical protein
MKLQLFSNFTPLLFFNLLNYIFFNFTLTILKYMDDLSNYKCFSIPPPYYFLIYK